MLSAKLPQFSDHVKLLIAASSTNTEQLLHPVSLTLGEPSYEGRYDE
jgi:hypothetical protein